LKGPRSRWTGIPRYPEHRKHLFFTPGSSGLLISNKALGKLLVEQKTLGWEHSNKSFENVGVVSTSMKYFQKCFEERWLWRKKEWWF
jgi:hypothetical protein